MRTVCLAAMALCACHSEHDHSNAAAASPTTELVVVPRTHQIPAGHAAEVRRLFEAHVITFPISVVSSAGTNTQFVHPDPSFLGNDRFVVAATPAIHDELDRMLAAMAKEPAPAPQVTYSVTYWAVEADPSAAVDIPPDLAEIKPVLESLSGLGPRRFKIVDRAATHSLDGVKAEVKSRELHIEQTLSSDAGALQLALELQLRPSTGGPSSSEVNTKLSVALDKPVILGETTADAGSGATADGLVLFVVQARAE